MSSSFKTLTRGVKFNTNRFLDDALKLKVIKQDSKPIQSILKPPSPPEDKRKTKSKKPVKVKRKHEEIENTEEDVDDIPIFNKKGKVDRTTEPHSNSTTEKLKNKKDKKLKKDSAKKKEEEQIRQLRRSFSIYVYGSDVPPPVQEFTAIQDVTEQMLNNIKNCGYEVPTAIQMQSIPILMKGRELLASAPTGSGKSAAFLIPTILLLGKGQRERQIRAVIVSPTKELATQIHSECLRLAKGTGLKILNFAGVTGAKANPRFDCDILITTPNRLVYALDNEKVSLKSVKLLIVDECDNLFDQGFQDQLGTIYSACDAADVQRAFFSATCAHQVEEFCRAHLDSHIGVSIGPKNSTVDQIDQSLIFVGNEQGKLIELRNMIRKGIQSPVLIFVQSQERADELYTELQQDELHCAVIHSGKNEKQRRKIIEQFRTGKVWVLICTTLLSRGMDFPAVRTVINYDMPASHVTYIHSVGRTGRAGRPGKAVTFFTEVDRENLGRIAQLLKNSGFPIPPFVFTLKKARKDEVHVPKRKHISKRAVLLKEEKMKKKKMMMKRKSKELNSKKNEKKVKSVKEKKAA